MSLILKRGFWNLSKSTSIGFIESSYKAGYLFTTEYISFRQTSSNFSNGDVIEMSVDKMPHQYKSEIEHVMTRRTPVYLEYSVDLIGSPLNGNTLNPIYANKVIPLSNEVVHTKPLMYDVLQKPTVSTI